MPVYRNLDRLVLFVHVPKTGGSSVEKTIKAQGAREAMKSGRMSWFSRSTPQHIHRQVLEPWFSNNFFDYSWTVVRNPYSRMLSEYRWRESMASSEFPKFDLWARRVLRNYNRDNFYLDNHIRPQVEFLVDGVEVFRLEDGLERAVVAGLQALRIDRQHINLRRHLSSKHKPVLVDQSTLDRIVELYRNDFREFGYDVNNVPTLIKVR